MSEAVAVRVCESGRHPKLTARAVYLVEADGQRTVLCELCAVQTVMVLQAAGRGFLARPLIRGR